MSLSQIFLWPSEDLKLHIIIYLVRITWEWPFLQCSVIIPYNIIMHFFMSLLYLLISHYLLYRVGQNNTWQFFPHKWDDERNLNKNNDNGQKLKWGPFFRQKHFTHIIINVHLLAYFCTRRSCTDISIIDCVLCIAFYGDTVQCLHRLNECKTICPKGTQISILEHQSWCHFHHICNNLLKICTNTK